jgi:hypothetical protein
MTKAVKVQHPLIVSKKDRNESQYYADLFDNEKFSDVTLSVGATQIPCHKVILSGICKLIIIRKF